MSTTSADSLTYSVIINSRDTLMTYNSYLLSTLTTATSYGYSYFSYIDFDKLVISEFNSYYYNALNIVINEGGCSKESSYELGYNLIRTSLELNKKQYDYNQFKLDILKLAFYNSDGTLKFNYKYDYAYDATDLMTYISPGAKIRCDNDNVDTYLNTLTQSINDYAPSSNAYTTIGRLYSDLTTYEYYAKNIYLSEYYNTLYTYISYVMNVPIVKFDNSYGYYSIQYKDKNNAAYDSYLSVNSLDNYLVLTCSDNPVYWQIIQTRNIIQGSSYCLLCTAYNDTTYYVSYNNSLNYIYMDNNIDNATPVEFAGISNASLDSQFVLAYSTDDYYSYLTVDDYDYVKTVTNAVTASYIAYNSYYHWDINLIR